MKPMIFAAALMLGGTALAQTNDTTTTTTTTTSADTGMAANTAPARDARGIPVVSDEATAPAGWNMPPGTPGAANPSAPPPTQGSAGPLPPCSRKVTDRCTQTYERGRKPSA